MMTTLASQPITVEAVAVNIDWSDVFKKNNKKLLNFIHKRVANYEDVEDIAQMTCLEVLRNCHKFIGASRPETWMFGIAINLIRNYYKNQQGRFLFDTLNDEILTGMLYDSDPSDITENERVLGATLASIETLPEDLKTMLSILVGHDGSYQDVAQQLNIPVGTVRSRLSRARETLKSRVYA
ncbi:sigma-70 family RNA polymerase sigma factor (plasmid) [Pantoea dispersa]|uniref:RNA polymerase sigma factor n=1 Tax=Pantoea dispersa TaxID=59814 RepID=UPI001266AEAF|nr:RNA polymerase sigma factor [Pantoea dispersa]QFS62700.1 sigma-70 family RNA polymerase sigma factor [Pantoea dispersa]